MPITQLREIAPATRLENVRYAIRDLACVADEVARQGHKIMPLNIGDPLNFDFETPAHMIEAVYKAMRDGKNGYSRFLGNSSKRSRQFAARRRTKASRRFRMFSSPRA